MHHGSKIKICKLLFRRRSPRSRIPTATAASNLAIPIFNEGTSDSPRVGKPHFQGKFISNFRHFPLSTTSDSLTQFSNCRVRYSSGPGESVAEFDRDREVDNINLKFADAREEIEMALESKETVYFDEEAECARAAVKEVVAMFEGLLAKLPEAEKAALKRSMGLKIEQLKAEIQQLDE